MTPATVGRALLLVAVLVTGCAPAPSGVRLPPVAGSFDYQLGGAYDGDAPAVVVRDATAAPLPGAYNVCYVNGFQSQPGEDWRRDHAVAVLHDATGAPVSDPDWPDEYVLDPSTPAARKAILAVRGPAIAGCADRGFDAVEIDNLDSYTRFRDPAGGRIDEVGALDLARSFVALAHDHRLAIGQKNAADLAATGRDDVGFDFAVAEECAADDPARPRPRPRPAAPRRPGPRLRAVPVTTDHGARLSFSCITRAMMAPSEGRAPCLRRMMSATSAVQPVW